MLVVPFLTIRAAVVDVSTVSPNGVTNIIRYFLSGAVGNNRILQIQGTNLVGIETNMFASSGEYRTLLTETNVWTGSNTFNGVFQVSSILVTNAIQVDGVAVFNDSFSALNITSGTFILTPILAATTINGNDGIFTNSLTLRGVPVLTNIPPNGSANTLVKWITTNSESFIANGIGMLTNDGNGNFGYTTNISQDLTINNLTINSNLTVQSITINSNLTVINSTTTSNLYVVNGKNNTLIVTNYVQMPWTTLTMSGSNVSTMDFASASMFKLTLTNNGFINVPSNLPGTNLSQVVQLAVAQDGTGGRSLTLTNSAYVISGFGTSTNAVIGLTTNANAVTILTFVTSPFSATKVYGVVAATGP